MIGDKVKKAREIKHMKQVDLAKKTGLANSTICDIEKGRIEPSIRSLSKIAEALELPIDFFISFNYENNVNNKNIKITKPYRKTGTTG